MIQQIVIIKCGHGGPHNENENKIKHERGDEYTDLATELTNLWNMKVIVIPIIIAEIGMFLKGLVKGLEGLEIERRPENILTIKF